MPSRAAPASRPFVRVPGLAYHLIAPVLDARAFGIMVPMIETAERAANLAKWCRYRPEGVRGLGFGVGHDDYDRGDVIPKMRNANERTLVMALIETATGIEKSGGFLSLCNMPSPTTGFQPPGRAVQGSGSRLSFLLHIHHASDVCEADSLAFAGAVRPESASGRGGPLTSPAR